MIQLQKPSYTHWLIESSVSLNIFFNVYRTFSEIVNYLMSCFQASIHYTQSSTKENDTFEFILYEKVKDKVYNCLKFLISVRPLRYKRLWQELIFFPFIPLYDSSLPFIFYHITQYNVLRQFIRTINLIIKQTKAACQYIRIKRLLVIHNNKRKSIADTWLFVKRLKSIEQCLKNHLVFKLWDFNAVIAIDWTNDAILK